jgi:hypothetical protein
MLCHLLLKFLASDFSDVLSYDAYYSLFYFWFDHCPHI